jgi:hypothetical protein
MLILFKTVPEPSRYNETSKDVIVREAQLGPHPEAHVAGNEIQTAVRAKP